MLEQYRSRLTLTKDRDAFILVLIDGDGVIFNDDLLSQGEAGGKEAANRLWNDIRNEVDHRMPDLIQKYKIVVRVYTNLKGLGYICHRKGILESPNHIEDFARGFTGSKTLFDFVDVGVGKDRADEKISGTFTTEQTQRMLLTSPEIFRLHLYDSHCRHIFVGCSHDNGYARLLEEVGETQIMNSITLLEGVPFEKELVQLKSLYHTTKYPGLFREEKIDIYNLPPAPRQVPGGAYNPVHTNGFQPPAPAQQYSASFAPPVSPEVRGFSNPAGDMPQASALSPAISTWATAAAKVPPRMVSPTIVPKVNTPPVAEPSIPRNKYGQRIDPTMKYDPLDFQRLKKIKMCNTHYLRGDCPHDPCTHDHYYQPSQDELATLLYINRMTPCRNGSDCSDPKCFYGHRCPVQKEGERGCRFGENCRFADVLHGLDQRVVNTVRIGAK